MVIGAGGASVMDCAKLTAFGSCHEEDLWPYLKGEKDPYGMQKLPLVLMPTYPSSGSEYGLGAVAADSRSGDYGTAFGIPADVAILTALFPRFLKAMAGYHEADIRRYFQDAFGYQGGVSESADKMTELFESLGADMYFDGEASANAVKEIDIETTLSMEELTDMVKECMVIRKRK